MTRAAAAPRAVFVTAVLVALSVPPPRRAAARPPDQPSIESIAASLFASLTPEQRARALLPTDSPDRDHEEFTGGPRPGVPIRDLDDRQQALALSLLKAFTSDYGAAKCEQIIAQDPGGFGRYYLAFFGEPGPGRTYAWRIAEHHLTLVHVEVERGRAARFGPILLGADPPTLWDDEEDALIALYAALTPQERERAAARRGHGMSGGQMPDGGVRVADLSPTVQAAARAVYEGRLKFYSDDIAARVRRVVDGAGGLGGMRVIFYGAADRRCRDGGRWDFKLGGPTFLCDYENSRGHIHLSMKGELAAGAATTAPAADIAPPEGNPTTP